MRIPFVEIVEFIFFHKKFCDFRPIITQQAQKMHVFDLFFLVIL